MTTPKNAEESVPEMLARVAEEIEATKDDPPGPRYRAQQSADVAGIKPSGFCRAHNVINCGVCSPP